MRRPVGSDGGDDADLDVIDDEYEGAEVVGSGLYSRMERSAEPVRIYVPGYAEYVKAWTGPKGHSESLGRGVSIWEEYTHH